MKLGSKRGGDKARWEAKKKKPNKTQLLRYYQNMRNDCYGGRRKNGHKMNVQASGE